MNASSVLQFKLQIRPRHHETARSINRFSEASESTRFRVLQARGRDARLIIADLRSSTFLIPRVANDGTLIPAF